MNIEEFRAYAKVSNVIPVSRQLVGRWRNSTRRLQKISQECCNTFFLESAEHGGAWSRYSFIGVRSEATLSEKDGVAYWQGTAPAGAPTGIDPLRSAAIVSCTFEIAKDCRTCHHLPVGLVGFMGYDVVRRLERLPDLSDKRYSAS